MLSPSCCIRTQQLSATSNRYKTETLGSIRLILKKKQTRFRLEVVLLCLNLCLAAGGSNCEKMIDNEEKQSWIPSLWGSPTFNVKQDDNRFTITKGGGDSWRTIVGTKSFSQGVKYWEWKILTNTINNNRFFWSCCSFRYSKIPLSIFTDGYE